jgi:DNA-binding Lrp family transcriptional regulator
MQDTSELKSSHEMATAHLVLNCSCGFETQVMENLKKIEGIIDVNRTLGEFDMLVKVVSMDYDSLKRIIRWKISNIEHVKSVTTLLCMRKPLCTILE